jgi:uncharacterized protein
MPANLTPEYRAAEAKYRSARSVAERRTALEEMLATIPRHKGTEKMQADLKRRLARLRQEEDSKRGRHGFSVRVEPEGAAQVVLLGPPNAGKSSLLAALTRAEPAVADYPFTTTLPQPGMMPFEDVQVQLVDLPPVTREHMDTWLPDIVRGADGAILLADATSERLPEDVEDLRERLAAVRVPLVREIPEGTDHRDTPVRTIMAITKIDGASESDLLVLEEMYAPLFPLARTAPRLGTGLEQLKTGIWSWLQLVRVYARPPGKPVDRSNPFVLPMGSTVHDLAVKIHRELADHIDFARVWGGARQGLRVSRDEPLHDGDVIELHF